MTDLTVDTDWGEVDTVAVERTLAGWPCQLTPAEKHYLLMQLIASFDANPAAAHQGKLGDHVVQWDARYIRAAEGLGMLPQSLSSYLSKYRKRLGNRHNRPPEKYARLSDDDVREIRRLRAEGVPAKVLAARYGTNAAWVRRIANRTARKDIE